MSFALTEFISYHSAGCGKLHAWLVELEQLMELTLEATLNQPFGPGEESPRQARPVASEVPTSAGR